MTHDFAAAVKNGKINSRWRVKYRAAGEALLAKHQVLTIAEAWYLENGGERGVCNCGQQVTFSHKLRQYSKFCSPRCGQLADSTKAKRERTNLDRHGVRNAGCFGDIRHKAALLTKYGTRAARDIEVQAKVKETNLRRHGTTNVFQLEAIKQKSGDTHRARHGVLNPMQREDVKLKFRTEDGKWIPSTKNQEQRQRNKLESVTERIRARLCDAGFTLLSVPTAFSYNDKHQVLHQTCGFIFEARIYAGHTPRCFMCEPLLQGTSKLERELETFVSSLGVDVKTRQRVLDGKEIDILVPSANLGIEVNGLYWHSELMGRGPMFHLSKTLLAAKHGIELLHFFEDDLRHHLPVVQSMIRNKLGLGAKIGARKCQLVVVEREHATAFCEQNHLKGAARFKHAVGLLHGGELVALGTFSKARYDKQHEIELVRFCSKVGLSVQGGFSKILQHFISTYQPRSIVTYADRSYSTGSVYRKCGFTLERTLPPGYWYFQTNDTRRHHPTQLRKYKLGRLYDDIDMSKTELELLRERGWDRVWDCGQLVFSMVPEHDVMQSHT